MIEQIDHIGIAVSNLEAQVARYRALFGRDPDHRETVPGQGVRVAMFRAGDSSIELLEPLNSESPISRFLEKRGEGIHHICFRVENLQHALSNARQAGFEIIQQQNDRGVGGSRVAFLHPRSTGGVLIELVEK